MVIDMRSIDPSFYKSKAWRECRQSFLAANPLCMRCLKEGRVKPATIVHHTIYLTKETVNDPSISLNFENLEAVCQDCHNKEHHGDHTDRRWKYVDGELIIQD